ncbi:MAG: MlaE family ABC transporter permease [Alphaproteobacteria bacterium]
MTSEAATAAAPTTPARVELSRPRVDTLEIRLAGDWVLRGPRASSREIDRELADRPPRRVVYDGTGIGRWDSALLTFLERLETTLHASKIRSDRAGLPEGVQRLMTLAEAVPEKKGARAGATRTSWLERVGDSARSGWESAWGFLDFLGQATIAFVSMLRLKARVPVADVLLFVQNTGIEALGIVSLISFLVGLILAFVGAVQLKQFGATIYVANLVEIGMAREMGAIMTGIIMAGRTGAAFAAQLGTMKVTEEIDALQTLGIDPIEYLVLPRLIALSLMMPLLCLYYDIVGMIGGAVVGVGMLGITPTQYWQQTLYYASTTQFALGIVKAGFFGVLVALAGCLRGMECGDSASAVGDAATSAVVTSIVLIVVADGIFAVIFDALGL